MFWWTKMKITCPLTGVLVFLASTKTASNLFKLSSILQLMFFLKKEKITITSHGLECEMGKFHSRVKIYQLRNKACGVSDDTEYGTQGRNCLISNYRSWMVIFLTQFFKGVKYIKLCSIWYIKLQVSITMAIIQFYWQQIMKKIGLL